MGQSEISRQLAATATYITIHLSVTETTPINGIFKLAKDTKRVFISGGNIFISTDWLTATSARR